MLVELELARIVITDMNCQHVLILREKEGTKREFPIIIGSFEATAIDRQVKKVLVPRPMTHDLLCNTVEMLGGVIRDVYIHRLDEQTFFASLRVVRDDELIEIDSRPSDAIAVAVSFAPWLPIFVDEEVISKVASQRVN